MSEQQPGGAQGRAQRALRRAEADQCGRDREHAGAHEQRAEHRLRVEEVRDDEEIAEESRDRAVAMRARFEELQAGEEHEQQHAGLPAEERAVLHPDAEHADQRDADREPARRQRRAIERAIEAPAVKAQRKQREPPRRAQHMRRDDDAKRERKPRQVAQREEAHFRRQRMRRRAHEAPCSASACRHAPRCASPRPGAISTPGRRSP